MRTYHIAQGKHYPNWDFPRPWVGKRQIARTVTFASNCSYDSSAYNSQDVNKLFGLSFGWGGIAANDAQDLKNGHLVYFPPVHWNSARFGWRWSKSDQCIELLAYVYVEGKRNWDAQLRFPVVIQIQPEREMLLSISYEAGSYLFSASEHDGVGYITHNVVRVPAPATLPSYGLLNGPYFGGELPAPHAMDITL